MPNGSNLNQIRFMATVESIWLCQKHGDIVVINADKCTFAIKSAFPLNGLNSYCDSGHWN